MYARTAMATIEITAILAMGLMRREVMGSCVGVRWLPMLYVRSSALVFVGSLGRAVPLRSAPQVQHIDFVVAVSV